MIIKISGLENGMYDYDFEADIDKIELTEPLFGKYNTNVVLNKFDDQIILEASTTAGANFICDRCGTEFKQVVNSKYKMIYLLRSIEGGEEEINITYLSPDAHMIDISKDVRDYMILSIPMKRLCKEDCNGLCAKCGADLNEIQCDCNDDEIDDRWKVLSELKNKLNKN
ncbi:MAG: hypothetical protein DRQ13_10340 [Ignavibacteriae bacterium]|nr:MAG: hypothetical protein DRQ13_10340 [Ignavibacteriota bacterium]